MHAVCLSQSVWPKPVLRRNDGYVSASESTELWRYINLSIIIIIIIIIIIGDGGGDGVARFLQVCHVTNSAKALKPWRQKCLDMIPEKQ